MPPDAISVGKMYHIGTGQIYLFWDEAMPLSDTGRGMTVTLYIIPLIYLKMVKFT
jgi:hypothetical protein